MKPIVYSLADVTVTIQNNVLGTLTLQEQAEAGGTSDISMSAGSQFSSVSYSYDNDMFGKQSFQDGGVVFTHNKALDGTITIELGQTSPHIQDLMRFVQEARQNPREAASTITITDTIGVVNVTAYDCFPTRIPGQDLTASIGNRSFAFICRQIDDQPYVGALV